MQQSGVHGLRHSSVTDMLESGVPIHLVQQHHGHKDSGIADQPSLAVRRREQRLA
jgi:site-specific recombinase XerD